MHSFPNRTNDLGSVHLYTYVYPVPCFSEPAPGLQIGAYKVFEDAGLSACRVVGNETHGSILASGRESRGVGSDRAWCPCSAARAWAHKGRGPVNWATAQTDLRTALRKREVGERHARSKSKAPALAVQQKGRPEHLSQRRFKELSVAISTL